MRVSALLLLSSELRVGLLLLDAYHRLPRCVVEKGKEMKREGRYLRCSLQRVLEAGTDGAGWYPAVACGEPVQSW